MTDQQCKKIGRNVAYGCVCKCDEPEKTFCPRHGRIVDVDPQDTDADTAHSLSRPDRFEQE